MKLFAELKRRNVIRVGLFYIVSAWLVIEVAETVLPLFDVPDGVLRGLVILLVIGFVPALVFSWIYELTPEGIKRDADLSAADLQSSTTGRKLNWATLVVAVAAIGFLAVERMSPTPPRDLAPGPSAETALAAAGPEVPDASIAVLPFTDLSPGADQEYFSDGMAEEILNALVRVQGLKVASRTSSFGFKGQESLGIQVIAERLAVRHVLEGSVRRAGNNLRITAQLIDAQVDRHLWSDTFDRPLTAENVFAIQEEIASAIVAALVDSLGIEIDDQVRLAQPTENLSAYEMYLRARGLFQARSGLDVADDLLREALEQDPDFVNAWALRAAVQTVIVGYGYTRLPWDEHERRGIEFAERALALDPDSGMALATLGNLRFGAAMTLVRRQDIAAMIRDLERAVELEPHNTSALNWLGLSLGLAGRLEDALQVFQRCAEVASSFGPCRENEYDALWALGRPAEAFERMRAALADGAVVAEYISIPVLAHFEEQTAFMLIANQSKWLPGWSRQEAVYAAFRDLDGDHAELVTELLEFLDARPAGAASWVANMLIPLGAHDMLPDNPVVIWGGEFARYRQSPQFKRFMRESGVLDYWREHGYPSQCRPVGGEDFECLQAAGR
jgi:adenylate cyclase